jgi:tetratricopeptide (TPR) repeat protein
MSLDPQERLHLALEASRKGNRDQAIEHLKAAIAEDESLGPAHFMLGAQYADLGMADRAEACMLRSLELAPDLHIARLQLGTLLLMQGRPEAKDELAPLMTLPSDDELRCFAEALTHLIDEATPAAIEALERGLACPSANPDIQDQMKALLEKLRGGEGAAPAPVSLGAYGQDR